MTVPTTPMVFCPYCGVRSDALKRMRIWRSFLCAIVFIRVQEEVVVACPTCMRQQLRRSLLINIGSANLAWPAMLLLYVPRFVATYLPGPSRAPSSVSPLLSDVNARPTGRAMARSVTAALLITWMLCSLGVALGGKHNDPLWPAGWVCFGVSSGLLVALFVLTSRRSKAEDWRA